MSAKADRSDPRPLAGTAQTHGTSMYVFTKPSIDVKRVRFYLDDPSMHRAPRKIESEAPFDFNVTAHDGTASAFEVSTLSTGPHTITAAQEQTDGRTRILSATFNVVAPPTSAAPVFGKTLVFEDNFDGAAVDTSNWSMYNGPGHDGNGLRRPSAFSVANGLLTVTASWNGQNITSGGMAHNENYTYGSFEVRVRTQVDPTAQTSGVVLTWPKSGRHPYDGENDWYETGTGVSRYPFSSFIHHHRATWSGDQTYIHHNADAADWQVMRMDWGPDAIRVYRNGVYAGALTNRAQIPDVPHHATIQLDAFSNRPLAGTVQMQVDYIRIYR